MIWWWWGNVVELVRTETSSLMVGIGARRLANNIFCLEERVFLLVFWVLVKIGDAGVVQSKLTTSIGGSTM